MDLLEDYRRATFFFESGDPLGAAKLLEPIVEAEPHNTAVRLPRRPCCGFRFATNPVRRNPVLLPAVYSAGPPAPLSLRRDHAFLFISPSW